MWPNQPCGCLVLICFSAKGLADDGFLFQDSVKIIALPTYWQGNASPGPYCGRKIKITNQGGGDNNNGVGNVVVATVADTCPSCDENHLGIRILFLETMTTLIPSAARSERGGFRGLDRW